MMFVAVIGAPLAVLIVGLLLRRSLTEPRTVTPAAGPAAPARDQRFTRPQRRVGAVTGLLVISLLVDPIAPIALGVFAVAWHRVRTLLDDRQRRAQVIAAVPDSIELLILMIRAGLTPHQAVRASVNQSPSPIRPGFVEVERRLERGSGLADALRGLPDVLGPALDSVADTLAIAERYGTPIGDALTQLSAEVRQQRRRLAEAEARKLPVKLSFPLVFCTLPSFVLVAIAPAVIAALSSLGDSTW